MRLGLVWRYGPGANYRAIEPLKTMHRRGHEVVWPLDADGRGSLRTLAGCDVVHVYRRADLRTRHVLRELALRGTAIVYDNDDDYTSVPRRSPAYREYGGLKGERLFGETVDVARLAAVFTTPSEVLAEKYRAAGAERVEVIANHLQFDTADPLIRADGLVVTWTPGRETVRAAVPHDGIVIGWLAGQEHRVELDHIALVDALRLLMEAHEDVRVETIGVDLRLPGRYTHDRHVPFAELPSRIGGWDIAIAPLADIAFNHTRSDIKLKEYAASGVPWLASPVGPYVGLGEEQGGRLVADDEWFRALSELVLNASQRARLGRAGKAWAERNTIDAAAAQWEEVFAHAAGARVPATRIEPDRAPD